MKKIISIAFLLCTALPLHAQQSLTFDSWFDGRVEHLIAMDANSNDPRRQNDAPPIDSTGTALVDRSSASDFFSMTIAAGQNSPNSNGSESPTGSITVTAYSLLAWASGKSITDSQFYKDHTGARRIYLTFGRAESTLAEDGTIEDATVVGMKYLLKNDRDIFSKNAKGRLDDLQANLRRLAPDIVNAKDGVQKLILQLLPQGAIDKLIDPLFPAPTFPQDVRNFTIFREVAIPALLEELKKVPGADKKIDEFLRSKTLASIEPSGAIADAAKAIGNGKQIALSSFAKFRKEPGNQDYNVTFIYDQPLTDRISWVFNAVGDYKDRQTAKDSAGGHLSTEFLAQLTGPASQLWARTPMTLSFSGDAEWATEMKPIYTFQAKLSIPISTGINLPIVYRYANRAVLSDDPSPEARMGISIDTGRLAQLFH